MASSRSWAAVRIRASRAWSRRKGQGLEPGLGGGLVHQVDGLVRQPPLGQVPGGEGHGGLEGLWLEGHPVVLGVPGGQGGEDGQGGLPGGLLHPDGLEAPLQSGVLLHHLPVLLPGGGPDELQPAPGQGGLEEVGRVDGPLGAPRPDEGVQLVQEEDHVPRPGYLRQDVLHPLFELPPVLGAGDHRGQVQGQQALPGQGVGHLAQGHPLGQGLHHGGLAHPGVPQEDGVVLAPAQEDLHQAVELGLPAHHGVIASLPRPADHVQGVLVQQAGGGRGGAGPPAPPGPGGRAPRPPGPGG